MSFTVIFSVLCFVISQSRASIVNGSEKSHSFVFLVFSLFLEKVPFKEVETTSPCTSWQFLFVLLFDCAVVQRGFFLEDYTHIKPLGFKNSVAEDQFRSSKKVKAL